MKPKQRVILKTSITADKPTVNNNIYPKEVLERVVREFNARARKRKVKGGVLNPDVIYEMGKLTHHTKRLFLDDDGVLYAEIEVMDNEDGKKLLDNLNVLIAVPIMCIPEYVDIIKKIKHDEPSPANIIHTIQSIARVQVHNESERSDK